MERQNIIPTGIPSLDVLLGGGIPARQSVVVTGDPGSGKTVLCSQVAFAHAKRGGSVVLATVASESHDKLLDELRGFSFFDADAIGDKLFVLSVYPWLKKGAREAKDILLRTMRERKATMLFIDGLRSLRDLWQDEAKLRDFLYELNVGIAQLGAVALFTTEYPVARLMEYPEATTVDGILSLAMQRHGGRVVRRAQVVKLRGRNHLTSEHMMRITSDGTTIVPRLEETTVPSSNFEPTRERATFGLPELDKILEGGLPEKSTTLLAGSTGVGKTLLSLHFCATGAAAGEPSLLVTYSEPVSLLVSRAKAIGLDVTKLCNDGKLHLEYRSSVHVEADELISEILGAVEKRGLKRVVIDGLADVQDTVLDPARVKPLLTALIVRLRDAGVTSVFVKEVSTIAGPVLDFSDTPISITAENMLFLRHVELRGRMHRILSVLKMRESGYDPYVREFEITPRGIRVLDPVHSAAGLLTGVPLVFNDGGR
jgi:circadian clock protein KaiC